MSFFTITIKNEAERKKESWKGFMMGDDASSDIKLLYKNSHACSYKR